VSAGNGGDGCISFLREKFVERGPPSGGNGGKGGDVYFKATKNDTSLQGLRYVYRAKPGVNGQGKTKHGIKGEDVVVHIPVGTIVREVDPPEDESLQTIPMERKERPRTLEEKADSASSRQPKSIFTAMSVITSHIEEDNFFGRLLEMTERDLHEPLGDKLFFDFTRHDQEERVALGGRGGWGNAQFQNRPNFTPRVATRGYRGQTRYFELELKSIAEVGLVGLPNAGKSTLLSAISKAHPKIASYPFTTLNPYIGTVDFSDTFQLTVADIPGLVSGAHKNVGLGHAFLRHVERSEMIAYVVDLGGVAPWEDVKTLMNELYLYRKELINKHMIIIANKADLDEKITKANFERLQQAFPGVTVVPVSAKYQKNVFKVTSTLRHMIEGTR
jgi:GTP-binding protein